MTNIYKEIQNYQTLSIFSYKRCKFLYNQDYFYRKFKKKKLYCLLYFIMLCREDNDMPIYNPHSTEKNELNLWIF